MKEVIIYSDGACRGNPGPGGWAAILTYSDSERQISGGVEATTNNRMELTAAIEAFRALREPCRVRFFTDSAYLRNGITRWVAFWISREWLTKGNTPVKNRDLWQELASVCATHSVVWNWTKGHSQDKANIRCDRLARLEIANINRSHDARALEEHRLRFVAQHWPAASQATS
jgi:ribonuclease HI